jgi:hypothetical protein
MKEIRNMIVKKIKEMTVTGTGAGPSQGPNPPIATPNAFKKSLEEGSYVKGMPYRITTNKDGKETTVTGDFVTYKDDMAVFTVNRTSTRINPKDPNIKIEPEVNTEQKDFTPAPHIPNRKSKMIDYKQLFQEEPYDRSKIETNTKELTRVQELLDQAHKDKSYSVMTAYENRIAILKFIVSLEKKLGKQLPVLHFSDSFGKYLKDYLGYSGPIKQNSTGAVINFKTISDTIKPLDESMLKTTQEKLDAIREKNRELYDRIKEKILDFIIAADPYDEEINAIISRELSPVGLNENYARFRNETSKRDVPEQLHKAMKEIKKKLQEVDRLVEYTDRLRTEITESGEDPKYNNYTERAYESIMEMIKGTYIKAKRLNK